MNDLLIACLSAVHYSNLCYITIIGQVLLSLPSPLPPDLISFVPLRGSSIPLGRYLPVKEQTVHTVTVLPPALQ